MADIEDIRRKIDHLISEKGLNYRDVSLKIGRKDSYMQQYVKYGYPRRLKEIDRLKLAKLLNISDIEIMDDEVIASKTLNSAENDFDLLNQILQKNEASSQNLVAIDILNPQLTSQEENAFLKNTLGTNLISRNVLEDLTSSQPENIKIIKVTGDSMKPTINPNDYVWFDCSFTTPRTDGLYLLASEWETMIKRIQISPLDGRVEISCDNTNYKTYEAASPKDVKVLGKIIYHLQRI